MTTKPWDAQLAYLLIKPLQNTWIHPNHLTTIRLITGLASAAFLAVGTNYYSNIGALCFVISNLLDHTDGELARLTGKISAWGHQYDLFCDAIIHILLFVGIGYGLRDSNLGFWAILMGLVSGIAVALIFHLRNEIEQKLGKEATRQPNFAGFEIEDILYLFPIVTLLHICKGFLIAATIGAPIFALWVIWEYFNQLSHKSNES